MIRISEATTSSFHQRQGRFKEKPTVRVALSHAEKISSRVYYPRSTWVCKFHVQMCGRIGCIKRERGEGEAERV